MIITFAIDYNQQYTFRQINLQVCPCFLSNFKEKLQYIS